MAGTLGIGNAISYEMQHVVKGMSNWFRLTDFDVISLKVAFVTPLGPGTDSLYLGGRCSFLSRFIRYAHPCPIFNPTEAGSFP